MPLILDTYFRNFGNKLIILKNFQKDGKIKYKFLYISMKGLKRNERSIRVWVKTMRMFNVKIKNGGDRYL